MTEIEGEDQLAIKVLCNDYPEVSNDQIIRLYLRFKEKYLEKATVEKYIHILAEKDVREYFKNGN